jgi:FtsH-binding integral membrane protein
MACRDPRNISCFFGIPEAHDIAQKGLEWNVFALIAAFEWISASFALGHLSGNFNPNNRTHDDASQIKLICLIWNLVGGLWLMPYTTPMSLLQAGITVLALLISTSVQYFPVGNEDDGGVIMHYTEYCTSASLLFVGVLILYIPAPQTWTVIIGFTGILLCNLTGVAAHLCKLDTAEEHEGMPFYDLDWGKLANHFKLYILHSWLGMLMSVLIIVYLARDSFSNGDIPLWVRFILLNLLVTYTLFGFWATACYVIADINAPANGQKRIVLADDNAEATLSPNFKTWVSDRLGFGLTVLSAAAKLPVAFTVFYGLLGMPGEKVCSIF